MLVDKKYAMLDEDSDFKYLTRLPMDCVSEENVDKLEKEYRNKTDELNRVRSTTIQDMWSSELIVLEKEYVDLRSKFRGGSSSSKKMTVGGVEKGKVKKATKLNVVV